MSEERRMEDQEGDQENRPPSPVENGLTPPYFLRSGRGGRGRGIGRTSRRRGPARIGLTRRNGIHEGNRWIEEFRRRRAIRGNEGPQVVPGSRGNRTTLPSMLSTVSDDVLADFAASAGLDVPPGSSVHNRAREGVATFITEAVVGAQKAADERGNDVIDVDDMVCGVRDAMNKLFRSRRDDQDDENNGGNGRNGNAMSVA